MAVAERNLAQAVVAFAPPAEIRPADVDYLLNQARQVMEEDGLASQYPNVQFFCNLSKHSRIEGMSLGHAAIRDITDGLKRHDDTSAPEFGSTELNDLINEHLSFRKFRLELICLLRRYGLAHSFLTDMERWHLTALAMFELLLDRPISLPTNKSKKRTAAETIRDYLDQLAATQHIVVEEIRLRWLLLPHFGRKPCWCLTIRGQPHIVATQAFVGLYQPTDFPTPPGFTCP